MKYIIFFTTVIIAVVVMLFVFNTKSKSYIVINDKSFKIDVAITNSQKSKGLAKYEKIPNDFGMLFLMGKSDYYTFWMKDMKFAIDIIYIDDNKIVDIFENVEKPNSKSETPRSVKSRFVSNKIFEINSGLSKKYGFKKGDSVKIIY